MQLSAGTTAETQADTQAEARATNSTEDDIDIRCGVISRLLDEDQHLTLLRLDKYFPHWSTCRSREVRLHYGAKWAVILKEMQTRYPNLGDFKGATLQHICQNARAKQRLASLRKVEVDHTTCPSKIGELTRELARKKRKYKKTLGDVTVATEHWRQKSENLAQRLVETEQRLYEIEMRARTEQQESDKKNECLQLKLKATTRKANAFSKYFKNLVKGAEDESDSDL